MQAEPGPRESATFGDAGAGLQGQLPRVHHARRGYRTQRGAPSPYRANDMSQAMIETRTTNPMRGPNKFKLGVFSANCDGGLTMSLAPEFSRIISPVFTT